MDHAGRRARLIDRLDGTGVVLFLGHGAAVRDYPADHYPFRQDASFSYFVGLEEPDVAATIDLASGDTTVFGDEPDLDDVIWHGTRPTLAERAAGAGADHHRPLAALPDLLSGREVLTLPASRADQAARLRRLVPDAEPSVELVRHVAALREVKDDAELAEIEQAIDRAAHLHASAMQAIGPGRSVADVATELAVAVAGTGGTMAYPLIFTTRGEVLHHHDHDGTMEAGDLLLHDGGVVSDLGYASDITRTMPVSGRFDGRAGDLHDIVHTAQAAALDAMAPGVRYAEVHGVAGRTILEGFSSLGLCSGDLDAATEEAAYAVVFPHGIGHLLGIEVHDMEGLGEDLVGYDGETTRSDLFGPSNLRIGKRLREGMVVTVEPGAYLIGPLIDRWRAERRFAGFWDYDALAGWVGIGGVRIEDDVVVTSDGARVLGPPIPRSRSEIEAAMA